MLSIGYCLFFLDTRNCTVAINLVKLTGYKQEVRAGEWFDSYFSGGGKRKLKLYVCVRKQGVSNCFGNEIGVLLSYLVPMVWVKTHQELTEVGDRGEYQFLPWNILFIVDNVYKGFRLLFVSQLSLRSFRLRTAGFHKAILSIYWVGLFVASPWLLVISVSRTSLMVGGFRSKALLALLEEETVPSAARCGSDPMFRFLFDTYMISLRLLMLNSEVKEMAASSSSNVDNAASIPSQEKELDECRKRVKELESENYINEQTIRKLQDQSEVIT